jgi:hypothetical protein
MSGDEFYPDDVTSGPDPEVFRLCWVEGCTRPQYRDDVRCYECGIKELRRQAAEQRALDAGRKP